MTRDPDDHSVEALTKRLRDDFDALCIWRLELAAHLGHRNAARTLAESTPWPVPPVPATDDAWFQGLARWPRFTRIHAQAIHAILGPEHDLPAPPEELEGLWVLSPSSAHEHLHALKAALGVAPLRACLEGHMVTHVLRDMRFRGRSRAPTVANPDRPLPPEVKRYQPPDDADAAFEAALDDYIGAMGPSEASESDTDEPSIFEGLLPDFVNEAEPEVRVLLEDEALQRLHLRWRLEERGRRYAPVQLAAYLGHPVALALLGPAAPERPENDDAWVARLPVWRIELDSVTRSLRTEAEAAGLDLPPLPEDYHVRYRSLSRPWAARELAALTSALGVSFVREALERRHARSALAWAGWSGDGVSVPVVTESRYRALMEAGDA